MFTREMYLASLIVLAVAVIASIASIIMSKMKRDHKVVTLIWKTGYILGILMFFMGISDSYVSFCNNFSIVPYAMVPVLFISFIVRSIKGTMKKWQWIFLPILVVFAFWFISYSGKLIEADNQAATEQSITYTEEMPVVE